MIFVCVGSRGYQFNRLLEEMDRLVKNGEVSDQVIGQTGLSEYLPKYYDYQRYMDEVLFKKFQREADIIISHGGTGALIGALKLGKQVIAVPRRKCFAEHIDDHQMQVSEALEKAGYLRVVRDISELGKVIKMAKENPIVRRYDMPSNIPNIIDQFIQKEIC